MELKPCPFCGSDMQHCTISFKRDKHKYVGVYHQICTIQCDRCTCSIRQAGTTNEIALRYAIEVWNRRVVNGWRDQLIPTGKNDEYIKCLETEAEHLESLHAAEEGQVDMRGGI